jgi:hypothetical protein
MADVDPNLSRWALEQREAREQASTHEAYALGASSHGPQPGWGGVSLSSSDNVTGARTFELDVRPVLLGQVEVRVRLSTQAPEAGKPHLKRTYLAATPAALRDLARQLLETADAADAMRPKPRRVP